MVDQAQAQQNAGGGGILIPARQTKSERIFIPSPLSLGYSPKRLGEEVAFRLKSCIVCIEVFLSSVSIIYHPTTTVIGEAVGRL